MWTKEKRKKYNADYYIKNSGKIKERASSWATNNPEKRLSIVKNYLNLNPEKRKESKKLWYFSNLEKVRDIRYQYDYGITLHQYNLMLESQKGLCAICGSSSTNTTRSKHFMVDHNHTTEEIRGLLCAHCNGGLGMFKADNGIENLEKAILYLTRKKV
jgi:Recombination endonuclease VII